MRYPRTFYTRSFNGEYKDRILGELDVRRRENGTLVIDGESVSGNSGVLEESGDASEVIDNISFDDNENGGDGQ